MRTKSFLPSVLIISLLLFGCKKDSLEIVNGTYAGNFKITHSSGTEVGLTTLELKDGTYTCTGNSNRIPAGGSGTYTIDNGKITFNDKNFWTADFDWGLILKGEYKYIFDGKKLKISTDKKNNNNYEYILEKK